MSYESVVVGGHGFLHRPDTCDADVIKEVIEDDAYGLNRLANMPSSPTIVDVGGHIGSFTRFAAGKWTQGRFFTFEANPMNYDIIERNLASISSESHLFKGAMVGKIPKNRKVYVSAAEANTVTGGWGVMYGTEELPTESNRAESVVDNWYTLGDVVAEHNIQQIDILKLDCEGSEFDIIMGTHANILKKTRYLVAEVHCGCLSHQRCNWEQWRARVLKYFHCPALEARETVGPHDLFNIIAVSRYVS